MKQKWYATAGCMVLTWAMFAGSPVGCVDGGLSNIVPGVVANTASAPSDHMTRRQIANAVLDVIRILINMDGNTINDVQLEALADLADQFTGGSLTQQQFGAGIWSALGVPQ